MTESMPPIPAATLILFDEAAGLPPRHLMLGRTAAMAFAGGHMVFPGGKVEREDHALAALPALARNAPADVDDAAARIAAVRETLEEAGVPVAISPVPTPETVSAWRAALKSGVPFLRLLDEAGASLDLARLVPFARWIPQFSLTRRFDTRFYVARHEGSLDVVHDEDEATHHAWLSAREALDDLAAGRARMLFPTACNLERLAAHPGFAQIMAHLEAVPCPLVMPRVTNVDGVTHINIEPGLGYETTHATFSGA